MHHLVYVTYFCGWVTSVNLCVFSAVDSHTELLLGMWVSKITSSFDLKQFV